ncbi:MAG: alpha/beta hydrolase [Candidatus Eremiobacteraeota bacterium]|nr:alpha/beta hydrolase [Candidatus Eremiobacteraeota bacterium]
MECDEVWKTFDQERLNAEYNASATVPSFEAYVDRWRRESDRVRKSYGPRTNIPYGDGEFQRLDLFPVARDGAPVLLYLHGGFWWRTSKDDYSFFAEPFLNAAAVAIPNYSLAPAATLDEMLAEMRSVILWLHANAEQHNGDPGRIVICGHSAGGQLGGMLAATDWSAHGLTRNPIVAMCGLSGLYDLEPIRHSNINEWLHLDEETARRNSPILHLPRVAMPLVATVGEFETSEFQRQTLDYAVVWRECGYPAECEVMTGRNHYDLILDVLEPGSRLRASVAGLIGGDYLTSGSTSLGARG